jgi:hypothetical protein
MTTDVAEQSAPLAVAERPRPIVVSSVPLPRQVGPWWLALSGGLLWHAARASEADRGRTVLADIPPGLGGVMADPASPTWSATPCGTPRRDRHRW